MGWTSGKGDDGSSLAGSSGLSVTQPLDGPRQRGGQVGGLGRVVRDVVQLEPAREVAARGGGGVEALGEELEVAHAHRGLWGGACMQASGGGEVLCLA